MLNGIAPVIMKNLRRPILNFALSLQWATRGSARESMILPKMIMAPIMVIPKKRGELSISSGIPVSTGGMRKKIRYTPKMLSSNEKPACPLEYTSCFHLLNRSMWVPASCVLLLFSKRINAEAQRERKRYIINMK